MNYQSGVDEKREVNEQSGVDEQREVNYMYHSGVDVQR